MPKNKKLTPELRAARNMKKRRLQWIEMLYQLRFGSPTAPNVLPGNCQDMLDFLLEKYWPYPEIPKPRFDTHFLQLNTDTAINLWNCLPHEDWARKYREPKSEEGHPIFYYVESQDRLIYLDGRCRLNKWVREDEDKIVQYWRIAPMNLKGYIE